MFVIWCLKCPELCHDTLVPILIYFWLNFLLPAAVLTWVLLMHLYFLYSWLFLPGLLSPSNQNESSNLVLFCELEIFIHEIFIQTWSIRKLPVNTETFSNKFKAPAAIIKWSAVPALFVLLLLLLKRNVFYVLKPHIPFQSPRLCLLSIFRRGRG